MTAQLTRTTRTRYAKSRTGKPIKLRIGGEPVPRSNRKVPLAAIRCHELDRYLDDKVRPDPDR